MKSFFIILILIIPSSLFSQNLSQIVKGKIVDCETKLPLTGATFIFSSEDTLLGTLSNIDGFFSLKVPIGRLSFKASYVGYDEF